MSLVHFILLIILFSVSCVFSYNSPFRLRCSCWNNKQAPKRREAERKREREADDRRTVVTNIVALYAAWEVKLVSYLRQQWLVPVRCKPLLRTINRFGAAIQLIRCAFTSSIRITHASQTEIKPKVRLVCNPFWWESKPNESWIAAHIGVSRTSIKLLVYERWSAESTWATVRWGGKREK